MLSGFVSGIFLAWFLTLFNVDQMFVQAVNEMFKTTVSVASYYIIFGIIGIITGGR